jgi:hypothetical protein
MLDFSFYIVVMLIHGRLSMRKRLMQKIKKDLERKSFTYLAKKIGMPVPTLWRIVNGKTQGCIGSWELIEAYYKK